MFFCSGAIINLLPDSEFLRFLTISSGIRRILLMTFMKPDWSLVTSCRALLSTCWSVSVSWATPAKEDRTVHSRHMTEALSLQVAILAARDPYKWRASSLTSNIMIFSVCRSSDTSTSASLRGSTTSFIFPFKSSYHDLNCNTGEEWAYAPPDLWKQTGNREEYSYPCDPTGYNRYLQTLQSGKCCKEYHKQLHRPFL